MTSISMNIRACPTCGGTGSQIVNNDQGNVAAPARPGDAYEPLDQEAIRAVPFVSRRRHPATSIGE